MAAQYWFASVLANAEGVWSGRFFRPEALSALTRSDVLMLARNLASATPLEADLYLPWMPASDATVETDACEPPLTAKIWHADEVHTRGALLDIGVAGRRVVLNTACEAQWTFAGDPATEADLGWLLNRPVPAVPRGGTKRSPVQLIQLLSDIERDADTRELEKAFRTDPELSYQLLRLLNSAAFGMRTPVKSLGHAITLLGRRQLQRWLQLLIYAQSGKAASLPNPLLQLAAYRGHLLEGLTQHAHRPTDECDAAYMVGIFSLLDRIIAQPISQIVRQLSLAPPITAALADGKGILGERLALVVACERGELSAAASLLQQQAVLPEAWLQIQGAAYAWAYGLGKMTADGS